MLVNIAQHGTPLRKLIACDRLASLPPSTDAKKQAHQTYAKETLLDKRSKPYCDALHLLETKQWNAAIKKLDELGNKHVNYDYEEKLKKLARYDLDYQEN